MNVIKLVFLFDLCWLPPLAFIKLHHHRIINWRDIYQVDETKEPDAPTMPAKMLQHPAEFFLTLSPLPLYKVL